MDLNLLPQDLRLKEEKEKQKIKKMPHNLEVELYNPAKADPSAAISGSDKFRLSWWQKLFGLKPAKTAPASVRPSAPLTPVAPQKKVIGNEWVKKYPAKMPKPPVTVQPRSHFWKNLFGKPALPIISGAPESAKQQSIVKQPAAFGLPPAGKDGGHVELTSGKTFMAVKPAKEPKAKASKMPKAAGDSWLSIFSNLFSFGRRDVAGLHFAGTDSEAEKSKTPAKTEAKPEAAKEDKSISPKNKIMEQTKPSLPEKKSPEMPVKEADKHKKKGRTAYHLVPKFEKGNGVNVNLLPGDLAGRAKKTVSESRFLAMAIILPMILITATYGVLWLLQQQAVKDLATRKIQLDGLQRQIGNFTAKEKANNDFANRLAAVKKLNEQKAVWSNFFSQLERYTLDGVYFTNLTVDTSGVFVLPGVASDYGTLAKQLALFKDAKDFIKDFTITNTELYSQEKAGVTGVSFQLRLTLQDKLLTLK